MVRRLVLALVVASVLAGGAASASAVEVGVFWRGVDRSTYPRSYLHGTAGRDVVAVEQDDGAQWRVEADPLTIVAPADAYLDGCARLSATAATCAYALTATLGGGDDVFRLVGGDHVPEVSGGPGDDEIVIDGRAGIDVRIEPGDGDDVVRGGAERDLVTLGAGRDTVDGGGGGAEIVLPAGGTVDLAAGTVVHPTGRTTVANVRDVTAEAAATVRGDGGPNTVAIPHGGHAEGRAGNDWLSGRGTFAGGTGDDHIALTTGRSDVRCGPGRDEVTSRRGTRALLAADCDRFVVGIRGDPTRAFWEADGAVARFGIPQAGRGGLRVPVACSAAYAEEGSSGGCRGRLALPGRGRAAYAAFSVRRGQRTTLRIPTRTQPAAGSAVALRATTRRSGYETYVRDWSIRLRR